MKNWRPDSWEEIKEANRIQNQEEEWDNEDAFEAGADAMLESLASLVGDDGWIQFEKKDGKVIAVYIDD